MRSSAKSVSVIIPTLNEATALPYLLEDLQKETEYIKEIIIVDAMSTDDTVKKAKQYSKVTVITSEIRSPAHQRSLGGKKATGEILVFMDADVQLPIKGLEKLINKFIDKNLDIACPYYSPLSSNLIIKMIYAFFNLLFFVFQKLSPSGAGSCIIVKRELFEKLDGFNQKMTYDDIEFIRRASRNGKFGMLSEKVFVSTRRFEKYGILRTTVQYVLLSLFFVLGMFRLANIMKYEFAKYED
ncbi:MAG: glycosyltransferase [Weeksellaceae bacterium]